MKDLVRRTLALFKSENYWYVTETNLGFYSRVFNMHGQFTS